jgi:2'-5' RNA ligase
VEDFFATITDRWPPGRDDYHRHVLPGSELLRDRISRHYAEVANRPGMARVRPANMHITVQQLAPASQVTSSELAQIVSLVRDRCADIAPFAVTTARAEAWEHAITCPIRPGCLLSTLWQVTTTAARQVTGTRFETRPAVYHPHLTIAYATSHVDQDPIRAWLSDYGAPEIPIPVTGLVLVAQRHNGREITFRVLDHVPLDG